MSSAFWAEVIQSAMIVMLAWKVIRLERKLKNHVGKGGLK